MFAALNSNLACGLPAPPDSSTASLRGDSKGGPCCTGKSKLYFAHNMNVVDVTQQGCFLLHTTVSVHAASELHHHIAMPAETLQTNGYLWMLQSK